MTKFTTTCRVVGIAENARYSSLRDPAPPTVYFPAWESTVGAGGFSNNLVFLIRSRSGATPSLPIALRSPDSLQPRAI